MTTTPSFTPPSFDLYVGRTLDYQLAIYEADQVRQVVLDAADVVRAKLWANGGEGATPAIDVDSIGSLSMTFTAVAGTDICTASGSHGLNNGDILTASSSNTLPAGLSPATNYYVINKTATTFKLSLTSGGAAIDITDAGTGVHTFLAQRSIVTIDSLGVADTEAATVTVSFHQLQTIGLTAGFYTFELLVVDASDGSKAKPACRTQVTVYGSATGDLGLT